MPQKNDQPAVGPDNPREDAKKKPSPDKGQDKNDNAVKPLTLAARVGPNDPRED